MAPVATTATATTTTKGMAMTSTVTTMGMAMTSTATTMTTQRTTRMTSGMAVNKTAAAKNERRRQAPSSAEQRGACSLRPFAQRSNQENEFDRQAYRFGSLYHSRIQLASNGQF